MTSVHEGSVHSISWCPIDHDYKTENSSQHLLMTAGTDKVIKLFDLRMPDPKLPIHVYQGHVGRHINKVKTIHTPTFLTSKFIATTGEGSDDISLYCVKTGKTISRGKLTECPTNISYNKYYKRDSETGAINDIIMIGKPSSMIYNLNIV